MGKIMTSHCTFVGTGMCHFCRCSVCCLSCRVHISCQDWMCFHCPHKHLPMAAAISSSTHASSRCFPCKLSLIPSLPALQTETLQSAWKISSVSTLRILVPKQNVLLSMDTKIPAEELCFCFTAELPNQHCRKFLGRRQWFGELCTISTWCFPPHRQVWMPNALPHLSQVTHFHMMFPSGKLLS